MAYNRVNWQNSVATPVNASNLNIMDVGLNNHETKFTDMENNNTYLTKVDDTDASNVFTSTWTHAADNLYYNRTKSTSNTTNASIERQFYGTGVKIYDSPGTNRGIVEVFIDNTSKGTFDRYTGSNQYQQLLYSITNLTRGSHSVKMVVKGTKNSLSSDYYFAFDYFEIFDNDSVTNLSRSVLNINKVIGNDTTEKIKGVDFYFINDNVNIDALNAKLDKLKADNVTHVAPSPTFAAINNTDNTINQSFLDSTFINICNACIAKGFKLMFKPHLNASGSGPANDLTPTDLNLFLSNYQTLVMHFLSLASFDIISIANEATNFTNANLSFWTTLINTIRAAYPNIKITNSNNYNGEYNGTVFLSQCDYIGLNFYPYLSDLNVPSPIDCKKGLYSNKLDVNNLTTIENLYNQYGKKILITEVGCLPYEKATSAPAAWSWTTPYNETVQANFFDATLSFLLTNPMVAGTFIWSAGVVANGSDDGFRFINRLAENVVKNRYGGVF